LTVLIALFPLIAFLSVRGEITQRVRLRRIDEICTANVTSINKHEFGRPDERWAEFDATSHEAMLFDLTCWTYAQFYPEAA
jgi:hypothetical protein